MMESLARVCRLYSRTDAPAYSPDYCVWKHVWRADYKSHIDHFHSAFVLRRREVINTTGHSGTKIAVKPYGSLWDPRRLARSPVIMQPTKERYDARTEILRAITSAVSSGNVDTAYKARRRRSRVNSSEKLRLDDARVGESTQPALRAIRRLVQKMRISKREISALAARSIILIFENTNVRCFENKINCTISFLRM